MPAWVAYAKLLEVWAEMERTDDERERRALAARANRFESVLA